ncbi:MAG: hypothetical protein ABIS42_07845, partial [Candidatus Limnocylindria bacterium]
LLAVGVVGGMGTAFLIWAIMGWTLEDAGAYWQAALRLRSGAELYPPLPTVESSDIFRYSPWFAWLTVPLTFLPMNLVAVFWSVLLVAASCVAVWPLVRQRRIAQVAFFWPILIAISASGNVHALLIAALVHGVERRSGPLWIALAASLKAVPLVLVLVYLGRRQWVRAAIALLLTAALLAPMLLYDLSNYPAGAGGAGLLIRSMPLYVTVACLGMAATLLLARTAYAWLTATTAAALVLPRFFTYDVTFLLIGAARPSGPHEASRATKRSARSIE